MRTDVNAMNVAKATANRTYLSWITQGSLAFLMVCFSSCTGDSSREEIYERARRYMQEERYSEAVSELRQLDEKFVLGHLALAEAFEHMGRHQDAVQEYRLVYRLDSVNVKARLKLGIYSLLWGPGNRENYASARDFAEEVLELEPTHIEARVLLGISFAVLGDVSRSAEEMKKALEQEPENLTAQVSWGVLNLLMGATREAEKIFLEALHRHPDSPEANRAMAYFSLANGNWDKTREYFDEAFDLEPNDDSDLYGLLWFDVMNGRIDETEAALARGVDLRPELRWNQANLQIAVGQTEKGLEILESLSADDPENRSYRMRLGGGLFGCRTKSGCAETGEIDAGS